MDENTMQEGFFRSEPRPRPVLEVKAPPSVGNAEAPPVKQCTVAVHYQPARPDLPAITLGGDQCAAGAELALATALAALAKAGFFPAR